MRSFSYMDPGVAASIFLAYVLSYVKGPRFDSCLVYMGLHSLMQDGKGCAGSCRILQGLL